MNEQTRNEPADAVSEETSLHVSRRSLLGGILAAAVAPAFITKTWAQPGIAEPKSPRMHVEALRSALTLSEPVPRYQHASAALADGRILVAGGWRSSGLPAYVPPLASAQLYDTISHAWMQAGSMKTARAQHAAVALADGRILVVGGSNLVPLASAEIYDPFSNTWTTTAPMQQARFGHAVALSGSLVVVSGGFNQGPLSSLHIYDVGADTWYPAR